MTPIKAKISGLAPGVGYDIEVAYVSHENILGDFTALGPVTAGNLVSENTVNVGSMVAATLVDEHIQALDDIANNATDIGVVAADLADEVIRAAAAEGALDVRTTSMEVSGDGALNQNPVYRSWTSSGSPPNGWTSSGTGTRTRISGLTSLSPYANQEVTAGGTDYGLLQNIPMTQGWFVVEADIIFNSGTLTGAGVYMDGPGNIIVFASTPDHNNVVLGATPTTGKRYRWRVLYNHTSGTSTANFLGATARSGIGSNASARSITWENLRVRPASAGEIENGVARNGLASLSARFTDVATVAATATAAVATRATTLETSSASPTALPDRVATRAFFTNTAPASPTTSALSSAGTVVAADNEGEVVELSGSTQAWWTRGALPILPSSTYRYTCRNRVTVDGTANVARVGYTVYDKNWTSLANVIVAQPSRTVANGWVSDTFEVTAASIVASYSAAAYIRPFVRLSTNTSATYSGATSQIAFLRLENITDVKTLQASITAVETAYIAADTAISATVTTLTAAVKKATLASDFARDSYYWTGGTYDNPFTVNSADTTQGSYVTVSNVGRVWQSGSTAAIEGIASKGVLPIVTGHKYRFSKRFRALTDSSNGNALTRLIGFSVHDASGTRLGDYWPAGNFTTFTAASGWLEESQIVTAAEIISSYASAAFARPTFYKWSSGGGPNGVIQLALFEFTDVTYGENIQAQVTTQAGAIATLEGKVEAYWEVNLSTGISGIDAFLRARVDDSDSVLGFGADLIGLFNRTDGVWLPALKVAAGDVTVYGNLIAGKGILLGTGAKWKVALQAQQFTITDGTPFYYDGGAGVLDLGSTPEFDFLTTGLAALAAGETYDLSMSAADGVGATPRLKIITPGATTSYSKGPTSTDSGGTPKFRLSKSTDPDANGNIYKLNVTLTLQANIAAAHASDPKQAWGEIDYYTKASGVWTKRGTALIGSVVTSSGSGVKTYTVTGEASVTLPAGISDFGVHLKGIGFQIYYASSGDPAAWLDYPASNGILTSFNSVTWSNTAASGTRSATPGSLTGTVIVRPKNVAA